MTNFGFGDLSEKLSGNGIHSLENVVTLDANFSAHFEKLEVWLEAIVSGLGIYTTRTKGLQDDQDNTYAIRARHDSMIRPRICKDNPTTLTSQHPDLPLPNRTFLAIHAACCRIGDLSGATKYIRGTVDAREDIRLLAEGGSSTEVS